jgi:hypothetical protein
MFEIRRNYEERFRKYFEEAITLLREGLKNERIFRFDTICYILTDMLKDGISRSIVLTPLIKSILTKTTPDGVDSFLKKLNDSLNGDEHKDTYYFVATSTLDLGTIENKVFEVNEQKIRLISFKDAEDEFKISSLFREWNVFLDKIFDFMHYSYAVLDVKANTPEEAMEKSLSSFELFRGVLNLAHYYSTLHYTYYGGIPEPKVLSILEPPRVIMLFNEKKEHLFDRFSIGFFDYSIKRFSTYRNKFLSYLMDKINSLEECTLKERCISAFRKYNNGLDGNVAGTSFLEFWKIFELIALSDKEERGMAETKVASRIASIFRTEFSRDVLYALCDKRNFIAHFGSLPEFDQAEINLVREYCEVAMLFLLEHVNVFKDDTTLECFYDNISKNEIDLDRLEKAISEIRKLRKQG